jgi:hypothetical protein
MTESTEHDSGEAPDVDRYDVRAYLHRHREGRAPEGRIRLHANDCHGLQVVGVLVAGYRDVLPDTAIASSLLDRLTLVIHGPVGLVVHHRDTSPHLAAWVAAELKARTTITVATINYVPTRKQRSQR